MSPTLEPPTTEATTDQPTLDSTADAFPYADGEAGVALPGPAARGVLEAGEGAPRPDGDRPWSTACPDCGAGTINGAGLFCCPDCDWTGSLR